MQSRVYSLAQAAMIAVMIAMQGTKVSLANNAKVVIGIALHQSRVALGALATIVARTMRLKSRTQVSPVNLPAQMLMSSTVLWLKTMLTGRIAVIESFTWIVRKKICVRLSRPSKRFSFRLRLMVKIEEREVYGTKP